MTTVGNHQISLPPATAPSDVYDPDDVGLRDSPPPRPMKFNLQPSPSPPPAFLPLPKPSPDSSPGPPGHRGPYRSKTRKSQSDAVLVHFMGGGTTPETARKAGDEPLACDNDDVEESEKGVDVDMTAQGTSPGERKMNVGARTLQCSTACPPKNASTALVKEETSIVEGEGLDLAVAALAVNRLRQNAQGHSIADDVSSPGTGVPIAGNPSRLIRERPMEDAKPTIPSINATYVDGSRPRSSGATAANLDMVSPPSGELPPIRQRHSQQSRLSIGNGAGPITLPSLSDQLGDINHLAEARSGDSPFPQSPPARPPPRFSAVPGSHGSPPKSPNDTFRRELPSPGRGAFFYGSSNPRRPSQPDGLQYPNGGDYSSSSTETPSTDQSGSTPAMAIDPMSIDGITNPQIGGFQCNYPGCTAQPFQTQYLLNSHANVHSSNRPHYCSIKGCPRSEGGKGFKRKNEMIRHGLVHDSPGYVCPFCPDREHKYPRPDNLQRHVRVHHVDKDKDDPQLRDVLSQRPEGPSKGRRRRGGTA